jgi:hypothetical protein
MVPRCGPALAIVCPGGVSGITISRRKMRPYVRPTDPRIQRACEAMKGWVQLGGSLETAAMLSDVSESQLYRWLTIAETHPDGPIAGMLKDLAQAAKDAAVRYPNGQHSSTGNIVGGSNGQPPALLSWRDL